MVLQLHSVIWSVTLGWAWDTEQGSWVAKLTCQRREKAKCNILLSSIILQHEHVFLANCESLCNGVIGTKGEEKWTLKCNKCRCFSPVWKASEKYSSKQFSTKEAVSHQSFTAVEALIVSCISKMQDPAQGTELLPFCHPSYSKLAEDMKAGMKWWWHCFVIRAWSFVTMEKMRIFLL